MLTKRTVGSVMGKHFSHFSYTDRIRIETWFAEKKKPNFIAERLSVHISSVYRELQRGLYDHRLSDERMVVRYSTQKADDKYRENLKAKGAGLKIGSDRKYADYLEDSVINERNSPATALCKARKSRKFTTTICATTFYSYITKGIFLKLTNKNLPYKRKETKGYRKVRPKRVPRGESIEQRPESINERIEYGHWEMDTVKGKKGTLPTLLVLTERASREEIVLKMPDGTESSVVRQIDNLERRYGELFARKFRSITIDNGSEFNDCEGMERSCLYPGSKRTNLYYCHPYASWERGSNENANKLIRRWIPKGALIGDFSHEEVERISSWINNYPRKMFGWLSANEMIEQYTSENSSE